MSGLDDAEAELRRATEHATGLASMASPELHSAVAGVRALAAGLQAYHDRLRAANEAARLAHMQVQQLRQASGLDAPPFRSINPDFGPRPDDATPDWLKRPWHLLIGALNGRSVATVARCLGELNGWLPGDPIPGDENPLSRAPGES